MQIDPGNLAQLAKRLTPPQRRAVLQGGPRFGRGYWPLQNSLSALGLTEPAWPTDTLSPLGRALRAHLQKETGK